MNKNWSLWIGSFIVIMLLAITFIGPHLPFIDKDLEEKIVYFGEDGTISTPAYAPMSVDGFPLGSDKKGRDFLSLIVVGAKDTLFIVLTVTVIRYLIAVPLGMFASNRKGILSWVLNSWKNLFSTLPILFGAILLMNLPMVQFAENRVLWVIIILASLEVGRVAYIFQQRAATLSSALFIEASKTIGVGPIKIWFRHYLPFLAPEILVNFFIDLGRVIFLIGQLGILQIFLTSEVVMVWTGAGEIRNTSINWAVLLGESRNTFLIEPWLAFYPALAITITMTGFFLLGEGLRKHYSRMG